MRRFDDDDDELLLLDFGDLWEGNEVEEVEGGGMPSPDGREGEVGMPPPFTSFSPLVALLEELEEGEELVRVRFTPRPMMSD